MIETGRVPGHEPAGVIAELGSEVTGWKVGDRVTIYFRLIFRPAHLVTQVVHAFPVQPRNQALEEEEVLPDSVRFAQEHEIVLLELRDDVVFWALIVRN